MNKHIKYKLSLALVIVMAIFFTGGCSPAAKQKMLKTFFDGVPKENTPDSQNKAKEEKELNAFVESMVKDKLQKANGEDVVIYKHAPFAERDCSACHESKFSQSLASQGKELCFSCHDDFLKDAEVKHFPAEEGMCLECHNPHQSENKYLLVKAGQSLCFSCHEKEDITKKDPHGDIGEEDCIECHDPHKGQEALLK